MRFDLVEVDLSVGLLDAAKQLRTPECLVQNVRDGIAGLWNVQVEHPVTEMVCGIDIVKHQIATAAGEPLGLSQKSICFSGHAIECRINAEDPNHSFLPSPGKVRHLYLPGGPGVRVDTHLYAGYHIPGHYDSLMAKLIVHDEARQAAMQRMLRALEEFRVQGVQTTIPLHVDILKNEAFRKGDYTTRFMQEHFSGVLNPARN